MFGLLRKQFKQKLSEKRKEYLQQYKLKISQQKAAKEQEEKDSLLLKGKQNENIKQLQDSLQRKLKAIDVYAYDPISTPIDDILGKKQQEHVPIDAKAVKRDIFLKNYQQQSEKKLDALLHLYHKAHDFVTYENLDEKVESCVMRRSNEEHEKMAIMLRGQNIDSDDKRFRALKDAYMGTQNGLPGIGKINATEIDPSIDDKELKEYENLMFGTTKTKANEWKQSKNL